MVWLSFIHRWAGGLIGFLLALLGLTGALLVWEGEWISLPHASDPLAEDVAVVGRITEAAGPGLSRITFASDEIGLHQLVYADGSGAYVSQSGLVVDRWQTQWERPELWLFDFHHHLFAGHTGETVAGIAGIAGLLFVVTGLILWWRGRRRVRFSLWPKRFAPGPIVAHHRDLGLVAAPLLFVSMVTGVLMLFAPMKDRLLGAEERPELVVSGPSEVSLAASLAAAKARFPEAALRRISLPAKTGDPVIVRMRQPFEWTPNGRTQLSFTPGQVAIQDAARANRSAGLGEKLYPVHSAKTGGVVWKLAMTASGLALALLGALAMWSFWARKSAKRARRKQSDLRVSIA